MIKLALWGLLIVAVAGLLAAAILLLARVIASLIGIALFIVALWWVMKLVFRSLKARKT